MRVLIFILVSYGAGLLVLRSPISANLTLLGGVIWLDVLITILFTTAFGLVMARRSNGGTPVQNKTAGLAITIVGLTIFGAMQLASANRSAPVAALASTAPREVLLQRARDGQFRAIARIDGADIGLLVDTGASIVLLRFEDALAVGFDPANLEFTVPLTTANGTAYVAPVVFASIRIGDIEVRNVEGAIAEQNALHSSLLGMSFLEQLRETVIRKKEMLLRQ